MSEPANRTPLQWREIGTALLLYAGLALLVTWPVVARLGSEIAGGRDDLWIHQWTLWWVQQALETGQSPFFTPMLYYPEGVSLTSHNIAWLNFAAWWPLQALLGPIAAYNLVTLAVFTLNGFVTFLFAREWFNDSLPAFVTGAVFGLWPYTISHYDHTNMMVLFPVSLALLFITRSVRDGGWRNWGLTAVSLALIGIARWQILLMSAPLIGLYVLFVVWQHRRWRMLLPLAGSAIVALLLMLPLALPLIRDQLVDSGPEQAFLPESALQTVTDLVAYLVPVWLYQPLWGDSVAETAVSLNMSRPYDLIASGEHYIPFLGFTVLTLAIMGVASRKTAVLFWLSVALLYIAFALGTPLHINGTAFDTLPMPYDLLQGGTIDGILRRPHRLNLFVSLPLGMLAGYAVSWVLGRSALRPYRMVLVAVVVGLILAETRGAVGFVTTPPSVPSWYERLAEEPSQFGVLNLPAHNRSFDKRAMFLQTIHGKPIGSGHVSRMPPNALVRLEATPILTLLLNEKGTRLPDPELTAVSQQLNSLADDNIRYLIFDRTLLDEGFELAWRDWLTIDPHYQDDELLVYRTRPVAGEDFRLAQLLSPSVSLIRHTLSQQTVVPNGLIKLDVRWGSAAAPTEPLNACLWLEDATEPNCAPIDPTRPTDTWGANAVIRAAQALPLPVNTPSGMHNVRLQLQNEAGDPQGTAMLLGQIEVLPLPELGEPLATWQNGLILRGYTQEQDDETVRLTTYWTTPTTLPTSYTLFIHLVDIETEEILSQSDAVPRGGQYPTNQWEPNELVHDPLTLARPERPFTIRVGWYDPLTSERLLLLDTSSDSFVLP